MDESLNRTRTINQRRLTYLCRNVLQSHEKIERIDSGVLPESDDNDRRHDKGWIPKPPDLLDAQGRHDVVVERPILVIEDEREHYSDDYARGEHWEEERGTKQVFVLHAWLIDEQSQSVGYKGIQMAALFEAIGEIDKANLASLQIPTESALLDIGDIRCADPGLKGHEKFVMHFGICNDAHIQRKLRVEFGPESAHWPDPHRNVSMTRRCKGAGNRIVWIVRITEVIRIENQ